MLHAADIDRLQGGSAAWLRPCLLTGQRLGREGVPQSTVVSLAAAWEAAAIAATSALVSSAAGNAWQGQGLRKGATPQVAFLKVMTFWRSRQHSRTTHW